MAKQKKLKYQVIELDAEEYLNWPDGIHNTLSAVERMKSGLVFNELDYEISQETSMQIIFVANRKMSAREMLDAFTKFQKQWYPTEDQIND